MILFLLLFLSFLVPGSAEAAIFFNNTTTNVYSSSTSSALDNLGKFTITAWINPRSTGEGTRGRIVDKAIKTTPTGGWIFNLTNADGATQKQLSLLMNRATANLQRRSANVLTFNKWQHVAVTWNGGLTAATAIKFFLNGVETAYGGAVNGSGAQANDSAEDITIGNSKEGSRTFDGAIAEVRIYNRVLTPNEIRMVYWIPWSVGRANLVGYWPLYNILNNAFDYSGYKSHMKLISAEMFRHPTIARYR